MYSLQLLQSNLSFMFHNSVQFVLINGYIFKIYYRHSFLHYKQILLYI